jgi:hypothetical protein
VLLGAFGTLDAGGRAPCAGLDGRGVVGLFFGLGFGGFGARWLDSLSGAREQESDND